MKTINKLLTMFLSIGVLTATAFPQFSAQQDAYTDSSKPTLNFGAATTLNVANTSTLIQTSYIQFDFSSIPAGFNGDNVAKATLKLFVNSVGTAGTFNVDFISGAWSGKTITANLTPALGNTIVSGVPLAAVNKGSFLLIDVTPAVQAWLNGTEPNDGIALVANSPLASTLDSNENTAQSHPPELDIVFNGAITAIDTAAGSGLIGGGANGNLSLSLLKSCNTNQLLQWNGTSWACSNAGTGTITRVTPGTALTGGGTGGNVTLNLDTTKVPLLNGGNTFTGTQTVNGLLQGQLGFFTGNNSSSVFQVTQASSSSGAAIEGLGEGTSTIGVQGNGISGTGVAGISVVGVGVSGTSQNNGVIGLATGSGGQGVAAIANASTGKTEGVFAFASSPTGTGTVSLSGGESKTGQALLGCCAVGVWGDTNQTSSGAAGLVGTADDAQALFLQNNSTTHLAANINNVETTAHNVEIMNIQGAFGSCNADTDGDLTCTGKIKSNNLAASVNAASQTFASSGKCLGALLSASSTCDTPGLVLTGATASNLPVLILANVNGVAVGSESDGTACVVANFGLVMDGNIIAVSNIIGTGTTSVTMVSLQLPAPGSHTFEVQESDDTGGCNSPTSRTGVGFGSGSSSNFSTRTLVVREF